MTLREAVYARTTGHAGTGALIGNRCYPNQIPQGPTYPLVVYACPISAVNAPYRDRDLGPREKAVYRVQLDCYARTSDGAAGLSDQVVLAWDGYSGGGVTVAWVDNRIDFGWEDGLKVYRQLVDVMITY